MATAKKAPKKKSVKSKIDDDSVWVLGTDMTRFGRYPDQDAIDLASTASLNALADGNVTIHDMDVLAERRNVHVRGDGRAATMSGLAHAYWFTGEKKYLPFLHWQLSLPLERGLGGIGGPRVAVNATHGSQLPEVMAVLAQVGELPAPLGPAAPETDARPLALKGDGPFYFHQPEDNEFSVTFEVLKPQARLVGKGTIVPTTDDVALPLEVAGLSAIDVEAIRVFSENMSQFLQVNDLGGTDELKRVGRVVWRDTHA